MFHQPILANVAQSVSLPELAGAFSYALDVGKGRQPGHSVRSCWIGMHVGRAIGLDDAALSDLYYTLLLKDVGCSSNAARLCQLYLANDLTFKSDYKFVDHTLPQLLGFIAGLRSIVAPVLLIATVVLSFAAALGVSALVFDGVFGFPGADPVVPLFGFVFLVALGVDYNIFLMTRVREESVRHGTRAGVLRGLVVTGGVITSAGLVLAATFAALGVIPILFLAQIGFIVAFGVLLDALVVRSLLVPALSYDVGRWIWWPSKLSRETDHADAETQRMLRGRAPGAHRL